MLNGVLTRWELSPESKFIDFSKELIGYLKNNLKTEGKQKIIWICEHDLCNLSKSDLLFKNVKKFCVQKKYNWEEVKSMIDEFLSQKYCCEHELADCLNRKIYKITDKETIKYDESYLDEISKIGKIRIWRFSNDHQK